MESAATRTLGIDLAAQPRNTAACTVQWSSERVTVVELALGLSDEWTGSEAHFGGVAKVGIDAPFGWPEAFVEAVATHAGFTRRWHIRATQDAEIVRTPVELVYRATDRYVHGTTGRWPLSVSADKIAYTAFRCAAILDELAAEKPVDRTGTGLVAEVYPAAALQHWGLPSRGYKGNKPANQVVRQEIVSGLERQAEGRLHFKPDMHQQLTGSDHMLDAFLSAIVAYAALRGQTHPVPEEHTLEAATEGWIHIPSGRISDLLSDSDNPVGAVAL